MKASDRPTVILKQINCSTWSIFSKKNGHIMCSGKIFGNQAQAIDWAKAWISTWPDWILEIEDE